MSSTPQPIRGVVFFSDGEKTRQLLEAIRGVESVKACGDRAISWSDNWIDSPVRSEVLLGALLRRIKRADFGVCLLTPDTQSQGNDVATVPCATRNVWIELGFCLAELGEKRTIVVAPRGFKFPDNIEGYQSVPYDVRDDPASQIAAIREDMSKCLEGALKPKTVRAMCLCLRSNSSEGQERDAEPYRLLRDTFNDDERAPARIQPCAGGAAAIWMEGTASSDDIVRSAISLAESGASVGIATADLEEWGSQFYGSALQKASSLMLAASPSGLVCDVDYVARMSSPQSLRLIKHDMFVPGIASEEKISCYCSASVLDWRCLAWPGLQDDERGLNQPGVTFLTHEGLPGRLERIKLHPPESRGKYPGDIFELIIDDYDTLLMYHIAHLSEVSQLPSNGGLSLHDALRKVVCPALLWTRTFAFVPIRCGLNAVAIRPNCDRIIREQLTKCDKYAQLLDVIIDSQKQKNKIRCAIFDNHGATMPLLLRACGAPVDVYADAQPEHFQKAVELLLRTKYRLLKSMVPSTVSTNYDVILGGGSWLNAGVADGLKWLIHHPREDGSFLWVEGAAAHRSVTGPMFSNLLRFLENKALCYQFQSQLQNVNPYPSCPVIPSAIADRWNEGDETFQIFEPEGSGYKLRPKVHPRGSSSAVDDELCDLWRIAWECIRVKRQFPSEQQTEQQ